MTAAARRVGSYGPQWVNDACGNTGFILLLAWMQQAGDLRNPDAIFDVIADVTGRDPDAVRVQVTHLVDLVRWAEWFDIDRLTAVDEWNAANSTCLDDGDAMMQQLRADAHVTAEALTYTPARQLQSVTA